MISLARTSRRQPVICVDCAFVFLEAHGSVLRCNRMTLSVKHYSNSRGPILSASFRS